MTSVEHYPNKCVEMEAKHPGAGDVCAWALVQCRESKLRRQTLPTPIVGPLDGRFDVSRMAFPPERADAVTPVLCEMLLRETIVASMAETRTPAVLYLYTDPRVFARLADAFDDRARAEHDYPVDCRLGRPKRSATTLEIRGYRGQSVEIRLRSAFTDASIRDPPEVLYVLYVAMPRPLERDELLALATARLSGVRVWWLHVDLGLTDEERELASVFRTLHAPARSGELTRLRAPEHTPAD